MLKDNNFYRDAMYDALKRTMEEMAFAEIIPNGWRVDSVKESKHDFDEILTNEKILDEEKVSSAEEESWGEELEWGAEDDAGWGSEDDAGWGEDITEREAEKGDLLANSGLDAGGEEVTTRAVCHEMDTAAYVARIPVDMVEITACELHITRVALEEILEVMLGEESFDEKIILDTVGELANTLTGRLMLSLEDEIGSFILGVPEFHEQSSAPQGEHVMCSCLIASSNQPVDIIVYF